MIDRRAFIGSLASEPLRCRAPPRPECAEVRSDRARVFIMPPK